MRIEADDLTRAPVQALIEEHLRDMHALSPPGAVFAFDVAKLRAPDVTFWTAWRGGPFGEYAENGFSVFMSLRL